MKASHTQSIPYFGIIFVLCGSRWNNVKTSGTLVFVTPDKFLSCLDAHGFDLRAGNQLCKLSV